MMIFLEELNCLGVIILMIIYDMYLMLEYIICVLVVCDGCLLVDVILVVVLIDEKLI